MSFLLDTDICSAHLKQNQLVTSRFMQHLGRLSVSAITVGELYTWAFRASASPKLIQIVVDLFNDVDILEVTHDVAHQFGRLRAAQLDAGQPKPLMDMMIAATALAHGLTLVTHNTQDFANIPGLTVVDWLIP